MKWSNLKQNKCPKCDKAFGFPAFQKNGFIQCDCGFIIREKRYSEIVSSQINQNIEDRLNAEFEGGEL